MTRRLAQDDIITATVETNREFLNRVMTTDVVTVLDIERLRSFGATVEVGEDGTLDIQGSITLDPDGEVTEALYPVSADVPLLSEEEWIAANSAFEVELEENTHKEQSAREILDNLVEQHRRALK